MLSSPVTRKAHSLRQAGMKNISWAQLCHKSASQSVSNLFYVSNLDWKLIWYLKGNTVVWHSLNLLDYVSCYMKHDISSQKAPYKQQLKKKKTTKPAEEKTDFTWLITPFHFVSLRCTVFSSSCDPGEVRWPSVSDDARRSIRPSSRTCSPTQPKA